MQVYSTALICITLNLNIIETGELILSSTPLYLHLLKQSDFTMNKDTEIDMKEVELNELDPEKQPMTGDVQAAGGEKNGSVKLKVPEDEVTFTGLSKEELMKVAGTPG